eukprot:g14509.t1
MIESKVAACSELAAATTRAKAVAKGAKNAYTMLVSLSEHAHDVALEGGSQEEGEKAMATDDSVWGARLAAARSWRKFNHAVHLQATAERELRKMRRDAGIETSSEDDVENGGSEFEYDSDDSDVTTGWDSEAEYFSSDEGDDSGPVPKPIFPDLDLEYESKNACAPTLSELENPEGTWEQVFKNVTNALVRRGRTCHTKVRAIDKVSKLPGARWKRKELVCKSYGKSTATPRVANVDKQRKTSSAKVKVNWNDGGVPTLGKVCLTHVDGCTSEPTANAKKNLVPIDVLQKGFEGDIRLWTVAGLRQFDIYRLITDRVKPFQLGEPVDRRSETWPPRFSASSSVRRRTPPI